MKKIIAVCLTFVIVGVIFAFLPASASNVISPTAKTYTNPGDNTGTENFNELSTKFPPYTKHSQTNNDGGSTAKPPITNPNYTKYFTNNGKDDPNSPNYTGDVNGKKDNSSKSPDTATGPSYAPVIIAVVTLMGTFAFAGTALKKKESSK